MIQALALLARFLPEAWKVPLQLLVLMLQTEQVQEALKGSLKLAKVLTKLKAKYPRLIALWTELEPELADLARAVKVVVNRVKGAKEGPKQLGSERSTPNDE